MTSTTESEAVPVAWGADRNRLRIGAVALIASLTLVPGVAPASAAPADAQESSRTTTESIVLPHWDIPRPRSEDVLHTPAVTGPTTVLPATVVSVPGLQVGSTATNPTTGRREVVVPTVRRTAVLIGDSQAAGKDSWPQLALRALGYEVRFFGAGGTGFVVANPSIDAPNYYDSLTSNTWVLPHGDPALVVVQGGGNDAGRRASDGDILGSANALLLGLERTYPRSRVIMIGTLSRSSRDGGGRRAEVDALLGDLAAARGITFVSVGDWLTAHELEDDLADAVHLTPEGSRKAAAILQRELDTLKVGVSEVRVDPGTWPRAGRPLA
ncbi:MULTISPECIES: SGNH/GDSL hydrolase family protein [unclassified Arthrobacter]|uniref:SGNH/GDSL hydrolase family protein n=1 Tax=unclassified Arthrobacter TaxID=235627 RepID=UPI0006FD068A|nr:SGNH/GDSL hydrolase family protein [Arthrobacter sp. Leaf234]KQN99635.1 hypothetical protein ASF21_12545 [Arthrobacter sp. Leaf234]